MKTIVPVIIAIKDAINTAAADKSFIYFTCGWRCGEMKSMIFSIAVLNISATQTNPVTITNEIVSIRESRNHPAAKKTVMVAARCIQPLCSSAKKRRIPSQANQKLLTRLRKENCFAFILRKLSVNYTFKSSPSDGYCYPCSGYRRKCKWQRVDAKAAKGCKQHIFLKKYEQCRCCNPQKKFCING